MKRYKIIHPVKLGPGTTLKLSPAQVATRKHVLQDLGDGLYLAKAETQWIAGEVIGIDGDLLPAMFADLEKAEEGKVKK